MNLCMAHRGYLLQIAVPIEIDLGALTAEVVSFSP